MKYKNIKAMAHNYVHSFLSSMNYVDEGYVIYDLLDYVRAQSLERAPVVQLIPADPVKDALFNPRIQKALGYARAHFARHCQSHDIEISAIHRLEIQFFRDELHHILAYACTLDDKGKDYRQQVHFSA